MTETLNTTDSKTQSERKALCEAKTENYYNDASMECFVEPRYIISIKIAAPGTPLLDYETGKLTGKKSSVGHMWYALSDGEYGNEDRSYGFAPKITGLFGPGEVSEDDKKYYEAYHTRMMEITKEQYHKLYEFGEAGVNNSEDYFKLDYNGVYNSCVDFVFKGLSYADIHPELSLSDLSPSKVTTAVSLIFPIISPIAAAKNIQEKLSKTYNGRIDTVTNIKDVQSIQAPFPKSNLNKEIKRELPKEQGFFHKLLSDNETPGAKRNKETV